MNLPMLDRVRLVLVLLWAGVGMALWNRWLSSWEVWDFILIQFLQAWLLCGVGVLCAYVGNMALFRAGYVCTASLVTFLGTLADNVSFSVRSWGRRAPPHPTPTTIQLLETAGPHAARAAVADSDSDAEPGVVTPASSSRPVGPVPMDHPVLLRRRRQRRIVLESSGDDSDSSVDSSSSVEISVQDMQTAVATAATPPGDEPV